MASAAETRWITDLPKLIRKRVISFSEIYPSRFALSVFFVLVVGFTTLLGLPISAADGRPTPFVDALFSAVTSVCVTGLSTVDMTTHWSIFGTIVLVLGAQIGGLGVLTLASSLGLMMTRRMGLRQRLLAASDSNPMRSHHGAVSEQQAVKLGDISQLLSTVAISTVVIELTLMVLYIPSFLAVGRDLWTAIWQSLVTSIMAFTNTGIMPFAQGITPFVNSPWFLVVTIIGVFLGSLGFPVLLSLARNFGHKRKRWTLHVKLTITTTLILLVFGAVMFMLTEWHNPFTLGDTSGPMRPLWALFASTMTRSGGFSLYDMNHLSESSGLTSDLLMFIGGGSASTAGGIKVTTLAVLVLAAVAEARGNDDIQAFHRRIPIDVLRVAVSILLWGVGIVTFATMLIMPFTNAPDDRVLFDVISAFATSGLSTGVVKTLPDPALYILSATMFAGRIGTITLAAALAAHSSKQWFRYSEERPIVG